jgi:PAS domain S-box-containing protein
MGPVEELQRRLGHTDEATRAELDVIHRNGLRLGRLVNSLLDFSRIEAGRMRARYEPTDLSAYTTELASVFRSAIERAGLRYDVDCPALSAPVDIDREMWEKIVLNLLSNALKFTLDGHIAVSLGEKDGQAVLRVADTGAGIRAAELPRLFDRFYRAHNARARSNEGSGIGLALVRELVALHHGTITVDSTEHEGTAFTVRLPFSHPGADAVPAQTTTRTLLAADPYVQEAMRWLPPAGDGTQTTAPAPPPAAAHLEAPRVLLADDNADMRDYLQRLLRRGYQVTTVTDGQAALDTARAHPPDLIISDVMMPRLDGLALVTALRADPRTADVPVLLLSARAGQEAAIEGLDAGSDDYLVKPFSAAELLARVRTSVQLSRMRSQHTRWRAALIESLHEAFFLCGPDGAVIEINSAFTDMLGYGPDGLPYPEPHPWWPDQETDPDAHRVAQDAYRSTRQLPAGDFTIPVTHRDGRRLWVAASFSEIADQDNGRLVAGTLRDVTADHYAIQRDSALAALGQVLTRAASMTDTLSEALTELRQLWHAAQVTAAIWTDAAEPALTASVPRTTWAALPETTRATHTRLRQQPPLTPHAENSGAGITLEHPSGTITILVGLPPGRQLTTEDQTLLGLIGGRLSQALNRAHQIDQQRDTALTLQRAILGPAQLPPGFSARYEPATRPLEVGGDWHDIITVPDGSTAIVVGDCVGHDLRAATVMGRLRSAARALLLQLASPAQVLTALDRFAASVPGAEHTTVFCAILNPVTGQLTYSAAGHPPAIVTHPDGATTLLDKVLSFPLATIPHTQRHEASHQLPARSTLLLYTDGLVERRGRSLTDGITEAAAAVAGGAEDPLEDLATTLMTTLAPPGGYGDDVAVVLYRHPAPLEIAFPARTDQLRPVRARLRDWLSRCGLAATVAQDTLVAAGEAVANAIEHGHRDKPGQQIRLRAAVTASRLRLTVADGGTWLPPGPTPAPYRGKGITLMHAMMDNVTIDSGANGTTVTMDTRTDREQSA